MLADFTPPARRSEAYGISRVANNAGMVAGPLIAAGLLGAGLGYRALFASGGLLIGLFLVLVLALLKESRPAGSTARHSTLGGYRVVLGDRRFVAVCAVTLLPLYGFGQIYITLPVLLRDSVGVSPAQWGLLAAFYAGCGVLFQFPVGCLGLSGHRLGRCRLCTKGRRHGRLHRARERRLHAACAGCPGACLADGASSAARPLHGGLDPGMDGGHGFGTDLRRAGF
jgi:hypothetical protein